LIRELTTEIFSYSTKRFQSPTDCQIVCHPKSQPLTPATFAWANKFGFYWPPLKIFTLFVLANWNRTFFVLDVFLLPNNLKLNAFNGDI